MIGTGTRRRLTRAPTHPRRHATPQLLEEVLHGDGQLRGGAHQVLQGGVLLRPPRGCVCMGFNRSTWTARFSRTCMVWRGDIIKSIHRSTDFELDPNRCINHVTGAAILEEEGVTGLEAIKGKIERLNFPGVAVNFGSVDVQSSIDGASRFIVGADERRDDNPGTSRLIQSSHLPPLSRRRADPRERRHHEARRGPQALLADVLPHAARPGCVEQMCIHASGKTERLILNPFQMNNSNRRALLCPQRHLPVHRRPRLRPVHAPGGLGPRPRGGALRTEGNDECFDSMVHCIDNVR